MTIKEKLQILLKLSGLTQEELARRLGITFVALNRWINERATPRQKAQKKIDELYKEYSGERNIPESAIDAKKEMVLQKRRDHKNVLDEIIGNPDIRDRFYLSLTYNTNRIEGSTLSENETAAILFENSALSDKSLIEQLEAKNHQAALEYLFQYLSEKKPLNERIILKLHAILMNAIRPDAGSYRNHGVRIMGSNMPTANYLKIPYLMDNFAGKISKKMSDAILHIAAMHSEFEKIHPFSDGNGRIGRLLMHAMAIRDNLAPVVVLQEKRRLYVAYLNKAQTQDDTSLLEDFLCDAILEGYKILERK
ncbi:MAG: Fic family protein [bacterium]|nr:Fic family protein [bacterium]